MRRRTWPIEELRRAIDCLPLRTRVAMLEGVRANEIIAGAYTDRRGGVCPMLAAHRCGGRTDFLSFARAWDRFTRARGRARRATPREVRVLTTHLEASLLAEPGLDLGRAIAEHRAAIERREREEARRSTRRRSFRRPEDDVDRELARLLRDAARVRDDEGDRELAPV
jgi:hypothetical protein